MIGANITEIFFWMLGLLLDIVFLKNVNIYGAIINSISPFFANILHYNCWGNWAIIIYQVWLLISIFIEIIIFVHQNQTFASQYFHLVFIFHILPFLQINVLHLSFFLLFKHLNLFYYFSIKIFQEAELILLSITLYIFYNFFFTHIYYHFFNLFVYLYSLIFFI